MDQHKHVWLLVVAETPDIHSLKPEERKYDMCYLSQVVQYITSHIIIYVHCIRCTGICTYMGGWAFTRRWALTQENMVYVHMKTKWLTCILYVCMYLCMCACMHVCAYICILCTFASDGVEKGDHPAAIFIDKRHTGGKQTSAS